MWRLAIGVMLLAAGCRNFESPTEPARLAAAKAMSDGLFVVDPVIVLRPGETRQVRIRTTEPLPLGCGFSTRPVQIAAVSGSIPSNGTTGTATVTARQPGKTVLYADMWQFGRAPVGRAIAEIRVEPETQRRRAVRH